MSTQLRVTRLTAIAKASGAIDYLNRASLRLRFNKGEVDPRILSGATSLGWLFDQTGTLRARPHNLFSRSEDFENAAFTKTFVTIAPGTVPAPLGATAGRKLLETASTGVHEIRSVSVELLAGAEYETQIDAKEAERRYIRVGFAGAWGTANNYAVVDLRTGLVTHRANNNLVVEVVPQADGWMRIFVRWRVVTTATNTLYYGINYDETTGTSGVGDTASGIFISGAQINFGSRQPYYPTTGSPFFGPRLTYDPSDLSLPPGLLAEEARTNSIRNSTMQGASAPSTLPANWIGTGAVGTLTRQISNPFLVNGIPCIDVRYFGTTSSGGTGLHVEPSGIIPATAGQVWTRSVYLAHVAGSLDGVSILNQLIIRDSAGAAVQFLNQVATPGPNLERNIAVGTPTIASTAFLSSGLSFSFASGVALDFTIRIGLPELSLGTILPISPPIPTFGTALTRSADNLSMTDLSWYQQSGGVFYSEAVCGSLPTGNVAFVGTLGAAGTSFNFIDVARYQPTLRALTLTAGVSQSALATSLTLGASHKAAHAFSASGARFVANGGTPLVDTSVNLPTPPTLFLGWDGVSAARSLNGIIREIAFIPLTNIPDSALQRMTR